MTEVDIIQASLNSKIKDLRNCVFGEWTILDLAGKYAKNPKIYVWRCRCSCGSIKLIPQNALARGNSKSCGCGPRKIPATCHGMRNTGAYKSWRALRGRCHDLTGKDYRNYGGRGIRVCERWTGSNGFLNFLSDMGYRPIGCSIDRIDVNKDYEPDNCRWSTNKAQAANKRNTLRYTVGGKDCTLKELSDQHQVPYGVLFKRLHDCGMSLEKALSKPHRQRPQLFSFQGEYLSIAQWSAMTGITCSVISQRIRKLNWSVERSLTTPSTTSIKE